MLQTLSKDISGLRKPIWAARINDINDGKNFPIIVLPDGPDVFAPANIKDGHIKVASGEFSTLETHSGSYVRVRLLCKEMGQFDF